MDYSTHLLPRGPLLGWSSFVGSRSTTLPSVQDLPHVALTSSGRAAIFQALLQLDLPAGSKVLVPTYHCPTMIAPVLMAGLQPVFYAVCKDGLPNLESLSRPEASGARALLVAHYFGLTRSLREVRAWCDQHGAALIEDCAHAFFGQAGERPVGAWGDFATASVSKFFPVPEGGLLLSAQRPIGDLTLMPQSLKANVKGIVDVLETSVAYQRLQGLNTLLNAAFRLKNGGRVVFQSSSASIASDTENAVTAILEDGYMSRIKQAPLAISRWLLRTLARDRIVERRRENYRLYAQSFIGMKIPKIHLLFPDLPPQVVPYIFPVWVDAADKIYEALRAARIPVFRWDRIWPKTPQISDDYGLLWSHHILQFLCHQDLSANAVRSIVHYTHKLANVS